MPIDAKHGQFVPMGRDVARILRGFFARIADNAINRIRARRPIDFASWTQAMVQALTPLMAGYFQTGRQRARRRILVALARRADARKAAAGIQIKKAGDPPVGTTAAAGGEFSGDFNVLLPQVRMAIEQHTFRFVQATLNTATEETMQAYREHIEAAGLVGTTADGRTIRFERHEAAGRGERVIMVDPHKLDAAWVGDDNRIPPGGEGAAGRRAGVERFLESGEPMQAPRVRIGADGKPYFIDGRNRFAVLRDLGIDQIALTIPTAQQDRFVASFGASTVYERTRAAIRAGVTGGEALKKITVRVGEIFNDPKKAQRIAMTETSRAMHAGQMQAAQESGIVKSLRWLASVDACDFCLELDGKEVPIGQPFDVNPKGGPYAAIYHPPAHPHCMCAAEEVIE
jgi:hypothetical protein